MSEIGKKADFFILGGMKCGTTSLFNYLVQHPKVISPIEKELHYYDIHYYAGRTLEEYSAQFPETKKGELTGEATPFYLSHPHCPAWIKQDFPEARFIVLLRNPVERFYSNFHQYCSYLSFTGSPEELITQELGCFDKEMEIVEADLSSSIEKLKTDFLLYRGRYSEQLERWFNYFDRDQFLFLFTEQLMSERENVVGQALSFLGLDTEHPLELDTLHHTQTYEPMSDSLRTYLDNYYAPHNAKLSEQLGMRLPW